MQVSRLARRPARRRETGPVPTPTRRILEWERAVSHVNDQIAARLDEVAQILEEQGANRYRVRAYRRGAEALRREERPVDAVLREGGLAALEALPAIGETLARAIRALVTTGRLPMLDRLRGEGDPLELLRTVPGIGRVTAERLHDELGIESLEDLEAAAHDGRLARQGILGPKRLAGVRDSLAQRLGRVRRQPAPSDEPPVTEILDVDAEYRRRAERDELPRIAPRRFNSSRRAWLPILHTTRGARHYTALFSNTARAHRLGTTRDWVVVHVDGGAERSYTVVTARHGPRAGQRLVRGRDAPVPSATRRLPPPAAALT